MLVSLDTLRADRLGCYGHGRDTSPTLDRLAAEGVRFADASAPSSKTAPSHMSMLSGLHPSVHGVVNFHAGEGTSAHPELPYLPERLRAAGYRTAAFTGGGMVSGELGFARGFEVYDDAGGGADRVFARGAEWLRRRADGERPFFLFLHTYEIHDPYTPPEEWQARFVDPDYAGAVDSTRCELPVDAAEVWKRDPSFYFEIRNRFWKGFDREDPADLAHLRDLYDAGIAFTDHELGRFWGVVEELGLDGEVLLVVTSDHGDALGQHDNMSHHSVYQEILHVPLIVRRPGGAGGGRVVRRPVQGVDLAASLAELAGVEPPAPLQGRSWVADLEGRETSPTPVWAELGSKENELAAVRIGADKLIRNRATGAFELYDLARDPHELTPDEAPGGEPAASLRAEMELRERQNDALGKRFPPGAAPLGEDALGPLQALGYAGEGSGE